MSYAKCKVDDTMKIIRNAKAYLICDRMPYENSNIIKSELTFWTDILQITYTYYDNSILRKTYIKDNNRNYIDATISLIDESNIVIKQKQYKDSTKTVQDIYREYRKEHNFISYAETL
jgi:hypothetical protein